MTELETLILEALAAHLPACGLEGTLASNGVRIPALSVTIRVRDVEERPSNTAGWMGLAGIFQTGSLDSIGGGMEVLHTGMGESLSAAAANAAHQWITGVLPVVTSYIAHRQPAEVQHARMVVGVPETGEQFGWVVHLGPIVTRMYSDDEPPDDVPQNEIYLKLFNSIHPYAAHKQLFWLECFAVHYRDGRVDATCRKHNDDWPEGRAALLEWAEEWPYTGGIVSQRQFMIFEPAPVDKELAAKLPVETEKKKPWWKVWS